MYDFKEGNTVRLRSGGPVMTIIKIGVPDRQDAAECIFFVDKKKKETKIFPLNSLEHANPVKDIG